MGPQKVRMQVKPTMDEDYLDEHVFELRTIDRDGNAPWINNRTLTLYRWKSEKVNTQVTEAK